MKVNLIVIDLLDLELLYVLLYFFVKDLVNMVGYVVSNIVDGFVDIV